VTDATSRALASVAERDNPLRRTLFVSLVLGKHVPVHPDLATLAGVALGLLYANDPRTSAAVDALMSQDPALAGRLLRDVAACPANTPPVTVIGFAETATGLAHAAAGALNATLCTQTTRMEIMGQSPILCFQERHSHAPSHTLYTSLERIVHARDVLLVDDEVTTAQTALNLIRELRFLIPAKKYVLATLIEHLGVDGRTRFAAEGAALGCELDAIALAPAPVHSPDRSSDARVRLQARRPARQTETAVIDLEVDARGTRLDARLGLDEQQRAAVERLGRRAAHQLAALPYGMPKSYLGIGEFLYLPMRIAALAGRDVRFWSTTRSPIRVRRRHGYPISSALRFRGPDFPDVPGYLYNLDSIVDDRVCVVFESGVQRSHATPLIDALSDAGVAHVVCLTFLNSSY
jgi:adenine/guanine phosphoribosyltransferase-like PRPP-binding protein